MATGRAALSVDAGQSSVMKVSEAAFYLQDHFVRKSLGEMIFSGVLERHPRLRVGSVEQRGFLDPFLPVPDGLLLYRPARARRLAPALPSPRRGRRTSSGRSAS